MIIIIVIYIIGGLYSSMQSVDNSLPQCSKDVKAGELEGFENPLYHTTRGDNEHIYESLVDYND